MNSFAPSSDQSFAAGAFHPDLPPNGATGRLRLSFAGAHFESPSGNVELPLDGLLLKLGGASDALVFLTHPAHPQVTIHTADHALLQHPVVRQTPGLVAQGARARHQKRRTIAVLFSVVGFLLAGVVGLVLARGWFIEQAAAVVPVEWEIKAGDALLPQIISGQHVITDPALLEEMQALTGRLTKAVPDQRYPLKFHIVEDTTLNAFALPGGNIVLHSGLLLAAESAEEVAGVLAHEIAHVTRRHSIRNILSSAGLYVVLSALAGDATGILAVLADNSAFLLDRKFSRDFEREADEAGWDYLRQGEIDPKAMLTFLAKLERQENTSVLASGAAHALEAVSTHPATRARIADLEARAAKVGRTHYVPIAMDYAAWKEKLRQQLRPK